MNKLFLMILALTSSVSLAQKTIREVPYEIGHAPSVDLHTIDWGYAVTDFQDWGRKFPVEKSFLNLYPGYQEPVVASDTDGMRKMGTEHLTMFRTRSTFLLDRPVSEINIQRLVSLDYLKDVDPTVEHRQISPVDVITYKDPQLSYANPKNRKWCEDARNSICISSRYEFSGVARTAVRLYNIKETLEGEKPKDTFLAFQSELGYLSPESLQKLGDPQKLTGIPTPVAGALVQNIFYINMVLQYGKTLVLFQPDPTDSRRTLVSTFLVIGIESKWYHPSGIRAKLLQMVGTTAADFFMGRGPQLADEGILSGLPHYTQRIIERSVALLKKP